MNCGDKLFCSEKKWIFEAGKMTEQLKVHGAPEIKSLEPRIGSSHLPITTSKGSDVLRWLLWVHAHTLTYTQTSTYN